MTTTLKASAAVLLAALLSLALFLSPVGISNAQDDATEDESTAPAEEDDATTDRPGRGDREPLTEEEQAAREAEQAERQAERQARQAERAQAVADELGVTVDALVTAFKNVAIAEVNGKLAAGDITQEQADAAIERIEAAEGLSGFGGGRGGHGRGNHGPRDAGTTDAAATGGTEI